MSTSPPQPAGPLLRVLVVSLIASIAATMVSGIAWFLIDPNEDALARPFGSMLLLVAWMAIATAACAAWRWQRHLLIGIAAAHAVVIGAASAAMLHAAIWMDEHLYWHAIETLSKLGGTALVIGMGLAHGCVMTLLRSRTALVLGLKIATIAVSAVAGALVITFIWAQDVIDSFSIILLLVLVTVVMVLAALVGTIVTPIAALSKANRAERPVESIGARLAIEMGCPKCGHRQRLVAGHARCESCRAAIMIELQEPRCACGYLLYRLAGQACPECGRPVPPELRWSEESDGETAPET